MRPPGVLEFRTRPRTRGLEREMSHGQLGRSRRGGAGRRGGALAGAVGALALCLAGAARADVTARLAYVAGLAGAHPQVMAAAADGSGPRSLGPGRDALLAPDGAQVAILTPLTRRGTSLLVRPLDGGPARTLAHASEFLEQVVWSPDAKLLAAVVDDERLEVINVATGARRVVARGLIRGVSFSPQSDRVVYGRAPARGLAARTNLWVADVDGSLRHAITRDGRSLYPLWGPRRIVFVHERLRRRDAPAFQLWLTRPDGGRVRHLTHMRIPPLISGLTPTAWSADGRRLLAEYGGQDTSEAWTVDVASGRARDLTGRFDGVAGCGLSRDGRTVLVVRGFVDDPASQSIATMPFGGGRATTLVRHGSEPSWSR